MQRNCPLVVFCFNVALAVFLTTSGFLVGIVSAQKNENDEATTAKAARIALGYEDWGKKYREVREEIRDPEPALAPLLELPIVGPQETNATKKHVRLLVGRE